MHSWQAAGLEAGHPRAVGCCNHDLTLKLVAEWRWVSTLGKALPSAATQLGSWCSVLTPQKARVTSFPGRTRGSQALRVGSWLRKAPIAGWKVLRKGVGGQMLSLGLVLVVEETSLWGSQPARPSRQGTPAASCPGPW